MEFMKYLANEVSNHINGILGKSKKVIVVDLDNTIWGGVVGDVDEKYKTRRRYSRGNHLFYFKDI